MRSKTLRRILGVIGLLGCAIVVGGWLFRAEIRSALNTYRADRLVQQAQAAFANEDWTNAARLGTAAHYLDPANPDTDLLVARALLKDRNPSSVTWWRRVLDRPDLPMDELRSVTRAILGQGNVEEGLPFLQRLLRSDGDHPATQRLWLQALGLQGRLGSAETYAAQVNLPLSPGSPAPSTKPANLALAVETAGVDETDSLASTLSREGEWKLLQRLMERRLAEDPDNPVYLVKLAGAHYYRGDPTPIPPLIERLPPGSLETQPVWESFLSYLRMLTEGFDSAHHSRLETLLARYPEILEYRLVLGLSFHLNGQTQLARGLVEDLPEIPLATARHLRVTAAILGLDQSALLRPAEEQHLLPRERYLLSQQGR